MAKGVKIRMDYTGIGEVMKSEWLQGKMADAAHAVAALLVDEFDEVWVDLYTTDRGVAAVSVFDRAGSAEGRELVSGVVTDAALRAGLEVGGR